MIKEAHNKIEYIPGQLICNTVFIKETASCTFPSGNTERKGGFVCQFCGNSFETIIQKVRNGHTISCGCHRIVAVQRSSRTHGLSNHPCFYVYCAIKERCFNDQNKGYYAYGGRGITMCTEWKNNPKAFFDYMEKLPHYRETGRSIDRINNAGNYEPNNIRWATSHEQATNKRRCMIGKCEYVGVFQQGQKFSSAIKYQRKKIHIGTFDNAEEAAIARDQYIIANKLWEYPLQILQKV